MREVRRNWSDFIAGMPPSRTPGQALIVSLLLLEKHRHLQSLSFHLVTWAHQSIRCEWQVRYGCEFYRWERERERERVRVREKLLRRRKDSIYLQYQKESLVSTFWKSIQFELGDRYLKFELFLSHVTVTCSNAKEWHALFTCITRVNSWYYKAADLVIIPSLILGCSISEPDCSFPTDLFALSKKW